MESKRFWTPKEAAAYLGIAVWTLYDWCRSPKAKTPRPSKLIGPRPPFRRFGRNCIRFPVQEFIAWAGKLTISKEK